MEIINKVAESGIISLDLEKMLPTNTFDLDIKDTLFMGLILKEKDFRLWAKEYNWMDLKDKCVAVYCSADAIIPNWAFMIIASKLKDIASFVGFGTLTVVEDLYVLHKINQLNLMEFTDKRVVIKGCGEKDIKPNAYVALSQALLPVVKSLMYGEPCSTVPVYKKP